MELILIIIVLALAFSCEFIDTSLGGGYGTILTPVLLLFGMSTLLIIPSILISEIATGITAMISHHRYKNCEFKWINDNTKIYLFISFIGIIGTILAVVIALNIPQSWAKLYIGILVVSMGLLAVTNITFAYSWKKIFVLGGVAGFNKSISGGGYGPLITAGQVVSGRGPKDSVGIALATETPICIAGIIMYLIFSGMSDFLLAILLTIGAIAATPFGALATKKITNEKLAKRLVGILALGLGTYTIINVFL
jgi:uncharacterized membrane protein YfcA